MAVQIPFLHVVSWSSRWVCNFSRQSFISLLRSCSASMNGNAAWSIPCIPMKFKWSQVHRFLFTFPKHHLGAATRLPSERPFAESPFALAKPSSHLLSVGGTCGHALIIEVLPMWYVQCIEICSSASLLFTASARAFAVTETTQFKSWMQAWIAAQCWIHISELKKGKRCRKHN